ncbi:UPF0692 protein C19orf54 homolog [Nematostella vectensis]|uniref:UPF0692 protein C19orf54 homolog n=1 Tax=Nematostella vectensis TaxID=45351 RepID=UPI002076DA16|nr:UPF0692 protein C19orf54 homolog [Nematostella vectensis]
MSESSITPPPPPIPPLQTSQRDHIRELITIAESEESSRIRDVRHQCRQIVDQISATEDEGGIQKDEITWVMCNTPVKPLMQGNAPRCGLVALSMAASVPTFKHQHIQLDNHHNNETELSELLTLAQRRGYSKHGEMLSAFYLSALAEDFYDLHSEVTCDTLSAKEKVLNHLLQGCPILVPYDSGPNHEPCLVNGRKAHWAVISGFLCGFCDEEYNWEEFKSFAHVIGNDDMMHLLYSIENPSEVNITLPKNIQDHIYLLVKQSKSRHTAVWSLNALEKSNCNLFEFGRKKGESINNFVLPEGGLREGLNGKLVFLTNKK